MRGMVWPRNGVVKCISRLNGHMIRNQTTRVFNFINFMSILNSLINIFKKKMNYYDYTEPTN